MSGSVPAQPGSSWAHRLLLAAAVTAVPLFLVGGTITTVGAGMAVQGWWNAEGHFMPLFPLDKWFRDFGTFVEHKHRLWGIVVGLLILGATIAALAGKSARVRWAAIVSLLAVGAQGTLGGFRVLENSVDLAFLHGVFGQGVFAILLGATVVASPKWGSAGVDTRGSAPRVWSWVLAAAIYAQITLGAWYRHALRNAPSSEGLEGRLHVHLAVAFVVLAVLGFVARRQKRAAADLGGSVGAALRRGVLRLHALIGIQILLGFGAWLSYLPPTPAEGKAFGTLEITFAALHVLGGALLLAQAVQSALWCGHPTARSAARTPLPTP